MSPGTNTLPATSDQDRFRVSPERLAEILDIAEDAIITVTLRREIVLFNRGATKIFGYAPSEILGQHLEVLLPPSYREAHPAQVEEFARGPEVSRMMGERREVAGRRKNGTDFPAEVTISKLEQGGETLLTAIVRDATARKHHEEMILRLNQQLEERVRTRTAELAGSEALLYAVLNSTLDPVITMDDRSCVTLLNPAAERVFGCLASEAIGSTIDQFLPATVPAAAPWANNLFPAPTELEGQRMDGSAVPLEVTCSRANVPNQTLYILILRDVTERKRSESELRETASQRAHALTELQAKTDELRATTQQLWQAARLAGVGELAASIAHELNNPLGTVSLRLEGVLSKIPSDDPNRRPLEIVEAEVERMGRLVANLLNFSRAGRNQVSTVNVMDEVRKTIELTEPHLRRLRVEVDPEFHPEVPDIFADRQQLRQVLLNLFTNAGDAMPKGGRLIPRIRRGELPPSRPAVVIEVADTGVGIPAEHIPKVTEPFFTTKDDGKGTGLGLAICRRIVQEHHGKLEIESEVGRGTTVRITLPVRNGVNVNGLQDEGRP